MSRLGDLALGLVLIGLLGIPAGALALRAAGEGGDVPRVDATGPARGLGLAAETGRLVGLTLALALPLGAALAFVAGRTDAAGRWLVGLVLLGLFVPLPLQALVWLGSFGNLGRSQALGARPWLVGHFGAAFVHAVAALPWVVLIAARGWSAAEPDLEDVARTEVSPWRAWRAITLRRAAPSLLAAGVLVAALAAGEMTVTDLIPIRTYAEEAYTLAQLGLEPAGLALRAIAPQLAVALPLALAFGLWLTLCEPERLAMPEDRNRRWPLGVARWPTGLLVGTLCVGLVALPIYGLAWRAGRIAAPPGGLEWSWAGLAGSLRGAWLDLADPELPWYRAPLWGSLAWSAVAAGLAVTLAWGLAWRGRRSGPWRILTAAALALTLAVPAPIVGLMLKLAYVSVGWMNRTPALMILAQAARALPFALLVLMPAVRAVPTAWVEAAALEGLGPARRAWRVGVRATRGSMGLAWLVAFALALGELPAAYFTRAPGYEPVAGLVWSLLHVGVESRLAAIGLILVGVSGALGLLGAAVAARRGSEPR